MSSSRKGVINKSYRAHFIAVINNRNKAETSAYVTLIEKYAVSPVLARGERGGVNRNGEKQIMAENDKIIGNFNTLVKNFF